MKPIELMELLNDLPDEMVDSAAEPQIRRSPIIRYRISAIAACLVLLLSAAVYPKLRIQKPEQLPESNAVTEPAVTTSDAFTQTTGLTQTVPSTLYTEPGRTTASSYTTAQSLQPNAPDTDVPVSGEPGGDTGISQTTEMTVTTASKTAQPSSTYTGSGTTVTQTTAHTTSQDVPQTAAYTMQKERCPLPVLSGNPGSGNDEPRDAEIVYDAKTGIATITLTEPCNDALIMCGRFRNGVLKLQILIWKGRYVPDDTIRFILEVPEEIRDQLTEIQATCEEAANAADYLDADVTLYDPEYAKFDLYIREGMFERRIFVDYVSPRPHNEE